MRSREPRSCGEADGATALVQEARQLHRWAVGVVPSGRRPSHRLPVHARVRRVRAHRARAAHRLAPRHLRPANAGPGLRPRARGPGLGHPWRRRGRGPHVARGVWISRTPDEASDHAAGPSTARGGSSTTPCTCKREVVAGSTRTEATAEHEAAPREHHQLAARQQHPAPARLSWAGGGWTVGCVGRGE